MGSNETEHFFLIAINWKKKIFDFLSTKTSVVTFLLLSNCKIGNLMVQFFKKINKSLFLYKKSRKFLCEKSHKILPTFLFIYFH